MKAYKQIKEVLENSEGEWVSAMNLTAELPDLAKGPRQLALRELLSNGVIEKRGERRGTEYRFVTDDDWQESGYSRVQKAIKSIPKAATPAQETEEIIGDFQESSDQRFVVEFHDDTVRFTTTKDQALKIMEHMIN